MPNDTYNSPFNARYASKEMQYIYSPDFKFKTWRKLWIALAEAEKELGLDITQEQIDELKANADNINYDVAKEYEKKFRHDVMSHVHAYGEQCPKAKPIIHLGATSCYVGDNTDVITMREALLLIKKKLVNAIASVSKFADEYKDMPCLGFTHFQPAQPTTVGKRATLWLMDLVMDYEEICHVIDTLMLLGSKGTTGTQASFLELFDGDHEKCKELDRKIAQKMNFKACFPVSGQTYARKLDTIVCNCLGLIAQSCCKFSNDLRLLQNLKEIEEKLYTDDSIKKAVEFQFNKLKNTFPKYYEEIIGKADGLKIDRLVYFSIMCPEIMDLNFEHCTTIVYKKNNGKFMISHNEDDEYIDGNFCLSKVKIDDENWFITNDMYNMPFGNGVSFNSYGIVKTINYCHDENWVIDYTPRYFSQRHIAESSSIDDLIKRCKEINNASGYHVTAIDINTNVAVSIEVYNDTIDVVYINDCFVHSNHFLRGKYSNKLSLDMGSNSFFRYSKAKEMLLNNSIKSLIDLKDILDYRSKDDTFFESILQTKNDPYETIFNFSYDTENKEELFFDVYALGEKVSLDYDIGHK